MYFDQATREEEARQRKYEEERRRTKDYIRENWNYTFCDSCGLVNCICGSKQVQMIVEANEMLGG